MKNNILQQRQLGLTLIEILIAMVLGIFLLAGVVQIFTGSQRNYQMQENLSRLQENGRFAMDFITRDVRMVGLQGCTGDNAESIADPSKLPNDTALDMVLSAGFNLQLSGVNDVATDWNSVACDVGDECIEDSDTIYYHYGQYCDNLQFPAAGANIKIPSGSPCNIEPDDIILVSNCNAADIFIATSASSAAGTQTITHAASRNSAPPLLHGVYDTNAQVFKITSSTFFIRTGVNDLPALWKMNNTKPKSLTNPVELVEGIEDMQILYGEDTDGDETPNYYVPAGTLGLDMENVVSVRISLLAATFDDHLTSEPRKYTYNGTTVDPAPDHRIRRVFSSTVTLRNRLP